MSRIQRFSVSNTHWSKATWRKRGKPAHRVLQYFLFCFLSLCERPDSGLQGIGTDDVVNLRMTRLVSVRVVCDDCRTAQALVYCVGARRALCALCSAGHTSSGRVDLALAVTALPFCERCDSAPAAVYCALEDITLCACCDVEARASKNTFKDMQKRGIRTTLEQRSIRFNGDATLLSVSASPSRCANSGSPPCDGVQSPLRMNTAPQIRMLPCAATVKSHPDDLQVSRPHVVRAQLSEDYCRQTDVLLPHVACNYLEAQIQVPFPQLVPRPSGGSFPSAPPPAPPSDPPSAPPSAPPPSPLFGTAPVSDQAHFLVGATTLPLAGLFSTRFVNSVPDIGVPQSDTSTVGEGEGVYGTPSRFNGVPSSTPTPDVFDVSKYFENATSSTPSSDKGADLKRRSRTRLWMRKLARRERGVVALKTIVNGNQTLKSTFPDTRRPRNGGYEFDGTHGIHAKSFQNKLDGASPSHLSDGSHNGSGSSRQSIGAPPTSAVVSPEVAAAAVASAGEMYLLSSAKEMGGGGEPPPGLSAAELHSAATSAVANASVAAANATGCATANGVYTSQKGHRFSQPIISRDRLRRERGPRCQKGQEHTSTLAHPTWVPVSNPSNGRTTTIEPLTEPFSKNTIDQDRLDPSNYVHFVSGSTEAGSSGGELGMVDFGSFGPLDLSAFDQHQQTLQCHQDHHAMMLCRRSCQPRHKPHPGKKGPHPRHLTPEKGKVLENGELRAYRQPKSTTNPRPPPSR